MALLTISLSWRGSKAESLQRPCCPACACNSMEGRGFLGRVQVHCPGRQRQQQSEAGEWAELLGLGNFLWRTMAGGQLRRMHQGHKRKAQVALTFQHGIFTNYLRKWEAKYG